MGVVIGQTAEVGQQRDHLPGRHAGWHRQGYWQAASNRGGRCRHFQRRQGAGGRFVWARARALARGAVVLNEVPPYCTVVGVPGRIVRRYCPKNLTGEPCEECETCNLAIEASDLDQIHMPDPVEQELQELRDKGRHFGKGGYNIDEGGST